MVTDAEIDASAGGWFIRVTWVWRPLVVTPGGLPPHGLRIYYRKRPIIKVGDPELGPGPDVRVGQYL